jgi:hypothetical protein
MCYRSGWWLRMISTNRGARSVMHGRRNLSFCLGRTNTMTSRPARPSSPQVPSAFRRISPALITMCHWRRHADGDVWVVKDAQWGVQKMVDSVYWPAQGCNSRWATSGQRRCSWDIDGLTWDPRDRWEGRSCTTRGWRLRWKLGHSFRGNGGGFRVYYDLGSLAGVLGSLAGVFRKRPWYWCKRSWSGLAVAETRLYC